MANHAEAEGFEVEGDSVSPGDRPPLAQRILHAAREEMGVTLDDLVYRRTELGDRPGLDRQAVERAAEQASVLRAGAA